MIKIKKLPYLLILFCFSTHLIAGKIVYPWRSTTAIVKPGETFEIWYNADAGQTVNAVELQSPFLKIIPTITNSAVQTWVYDQWSGNTCNLKLTVKVPVDAPMDRYDLIMNTSSGIETSLAAVKVVKEYKTNFYIMHFSDAHRWQGTYDTPNIILREISTIIDIANIIDPEMLLETGDNHYPNTNIPASTAQRVNDYMNGFMNGSVYINGMNNSFAPVFCIPGNHDTPQKNYELEPGYPAAGYEKVPSQYFNEFYGLQAHNFCYGNVRFIGLNNAWFPDDGKGTPNFSHQTTEAIIWLNKVGKGTMRIGYCHVNTSQPLNAFYNPLKAAGAPLDLIAFGHCHSISNSPFTVDNKKIGYSTLTPRDGTRKVPFNLYKINAEAGTYEAVGNEQAFQEGIETAKDYSTVKLKLTYQQQNDGTNATNTATIINKFSFKIDGARVRFVAPKGNQYYVKNARIKQEFDGTNFHVIDATVDLEASGTTVVTLHQGIQEDLCPNDPDKMDPGICGCGIPEGSCPIALTDVSIQPATVFVNINSYRQLTANVLPVNATNKTVNWESSHPEIVSVNSFGRITALSAGNAIITATTTDGAKKATSSVTVVMSESTYQAEDAEYSGPLEVTNQPGFNGRAFLDFTNPSNDFIKWYVYVPADDVYTLNFRYALASGSRPLKLSVNDEVRIASVAFPVTGAWNNWSNYVTSQSLDAGVNTISLSAIGSSGGNFDELTISGNGINASKNVASGNSGKSIRIFRTEKSPGQLGVEMTGYENSNHVQVKILNITGQIVSRKYLHQPTSLETSTFELCPKSMYVLTVESEGSVLSGKISMN